MERKDRTLGFFISDDEPALPLHTCLTNLFNKKTNSRRTDEEPRARYEEIQRALDPTTPYAERPDWAKNRNASFAYIQATFRNQNRNDNKPKWKLEEIKLVGECKS